MRARHPQSDEYNLSYDGGGIDRWQTGSSAISNTAERYLRW